MYLINCIFIALSFIFIIIILQMYLGIRVMKQLDKPRVSVDPNLNDFQQRCQNFLIIACKEIKNRYYFNNPILSSLSVLDPTRALSQIKRDTTPSLLPLVPLLPRCTDSSESNLQKLDDEWRRLPNFIDCIPAEIIKTTEPDTFWHQV